MLESSHNIINASLDRRLSRMFSFFSKTIPAALLLAVILSVSAVAQGVGSIPYKGLETDARKEPAVLSHLPDLENVRSQANFATSASGLKSILGDRKILDLIDFSGGTEAATAPYPAGKLLIIEYSAPQDSIDADAQFRSALTDQTDIVYRRIGNYNAFVFDAADKDTANALLDEVKYEKTIQWLGKNPFIISPERAFVLTISDVFLSTVLVILLWVASALFLGGTIGYAFYHFREKRRAAAATFTDAGGMTRLNLDGLTPDFAPERLLSD